VTSWAGKLCDDFRGGGLGIDCGSCLPTFWSPLPDLSPSRTVELDDDEVNDSLTAGSPWGSEKEPPMSFEKLPALRLVTGGLE
jgi:hypothetical protein